VVTVTGHGYQNGDVVAIIGHTTNTAANVVGTVGSVTTNTFQLTNLIGGAAVNGNGLGGATGTVQRLVIGLHPEDLGDLERTLQSHSYKQGSDANRSASSTVETILGV